MKILLISRLFPPSNEMGAVRPKNIADHLHAFGHEVTCVTDIAGSYRDCVDYRVLRVDTGRIGRWYREHNEKRLKEAFANTPQEPAEARKPSALSALLKALKEEAINLIYVIDETEWARNVCKALRTESPGATYDVLLTSFGPLSTVLVGFRLKKARQRAVWISDMRDAMDVYSQSGWRRILFSHLQRRMVHQADAITTVSWAMAKKYEAMNGAPVYTIENGYARAADQPPTKTKGALTICYTGSLYGGLRRMEALFEAIAEINRREQRPADILVRYAGADNHLAVEQARAYGVSNQLETLGLLPREASMRLQLTSDILCVVSWNTPKEQGILTGKFPEYMRLRKPILSIVSGELPNAELSERVRQCGEAGLDFEYAREGDKRRMADWLYGLLRRKEQGLALPTIDAEVATRYDYERLMRSFNEIILNAKTR